MILTIRWNDLSCNDGINCQIIGKKLATLACCAATNSLKLQKINKDLSRVIQRDLMNWINKDSDTFGG